MYAIVPVELLQMEHWFEMDIVMTDKVRAVVDAAMASAISNNPERQRKASTSMDEDLWPGARVPYLFESFVSELEERGQTHQVPLC